MSDLAYSIYCDESCYLEHDGIKQMGLGAVWCSTAKTKEISKRLIEIKERHGMEHEDELKWTKISAHHFQPYLDFVDYFFDDDDLHFRGLLIPDKTILDHEKYGQTHDEWYYKMLFTLLNPLIDPKYRYVINLDYKDTHGGERVKKLREVLCNNYYDFDRGIIGDINLVKSHQVEILQMTDLLVGALTYNARSLGGNDGKLKIVDRIKRRSGYSLNSTTLYREEKFNLLVWRPGVYSW
ncbi:MAG: DUF3800 domain-containing protein [Rectinemataceae bacterium]